MNNKGLAKIVSGLLLMIVGGLGVIFGKKAKTRLVRVGVLLGSVISLGAGFYLFVDGVTDMAVGRAGQYQLGGPAVQEMRYADPEAFERGILLSTSTTDMRRIDFNCPDGTESFRVFITGLGVFGIPPKEVICGDGFKLLTYRIKQ